MKEEGNENNNLIVNPHKPGLESIDKGRINKIIQEASQKSRFHKRQQEKQVELSQKIQGMKQKLQNLSREDLNRFKSTADDFINELEMVREEEQRVSNPFATFVHIDMDAFYAAVEMRDNPSLAEVPMVIK